MVEGAERLGYYPLFPSRLTPLGFVDKVLVILQDSYAAEYAWMEHITLSSPIFDEDGCWCTPDTQPVDRAKVRLWRASASGTFSRIRAFTVVEDLKTNIKSSWACI